MRYFILFPDDTMDDVIKDDRQLGEDNGFGVFWAASGFKVLKKIIDTDHDVINHIKIISDRGKHLTAEEFLDAISKLKVRIPN